MVKLGGKAQDFLILILDFWPLALPYYAYTRNFNYNTDIIFFYYYLMVILQGFSEKSARINWGGRRKKILIPF